jgi:hypothetical protein
MLRTVLALLATAFLASPLRAVTYTENGDAGQLRQTAQVTAALPANQPLTAIFGSLLNAADIDLFAINITNPLAFSASTVNLLTANAGVDTALFLFDSNGRPVFANDDDPSGTTVTSTLSSGSSFGPQVAGLYYIAISLSGAEPVNFANINLFTFMSSTALRGPNPNAPGALADWDTSQVNGGGTTFAANYQIDLTGATAVVPEPATVALAVFGALAVFAAARRRRD